MIKIKNIMKSPSLMSWLSLFSRLILGLILLKLIITDLTDMEISFWFFLVIMSKFRDVFDLGMLENFSRSYSYVKGEDSLKSIKGDRFSDFMYLSNRKYKIAFLYCCFFYIIVGSSTLYYKFSDINEFLLYCGLFLIYSFSNAVYLYSNKYVALIVGMGEIAVLKKWDSIMTGFQILLIIVCFYYYESITVLVLIASIFLFLVMIRNKFLCERILKGESVVISAYKKDGYLYEKIIQNSNRDFFSGLFGVGLIQTINLFVSSYFSIQVSNTYLLLDSILEHVKNISRVPFFVKLPSFSMEFKRLGVLTVRNVFKPILISILVMFFSLTVFYFSGEYILGLLGSNVIFNQSLWMCLSIYCIVERIVYMQYEVFLVVSNTVLSHILLFITSVLAIFYTGGIHLYQSIEILYIPLILALAYSTVYLPWVSIINYKYFFKNEIFGS